MILFCKVFKPPAAINSRFHIPLDCLNFALLRLDETIKLSVISLQSYVINCRCPCNLANHRFELRPFPFKALTLHDRILDQHCLLNLIQYNISIWCHSHGTTALKIQVLPSFSIPSTKYMQDDTLIPTIQVWEARPNFKHVQIQARPNSNSIGPLGSTSKIKPSNL